MFTSATKLHEDASSFQTAEQRAITCVANEISHYLKQRSGYYNNLTYTIPSSFWGIPSFNRDRVIAEITNQLINANYDCRLSDCRRDLYISWSHVVPTKKQDIQSQPQSHSQSQSQPISIPVLQSSVQSSVQSSIQSSVQSSIQSSVPINAQPKMNNVATADGTLSIEIPAQSKSITRTRISKAKAKPYSHPKPQQQQQQQHQPELQQLQSQSHPKPQSNSHIKSKPVPVQETTTTTSAKDIQSIMERYQRFSQYVHPVLAKQTTESTPMPMPMPERTTESTSIPKPKSMPKPKAKAKPNARVSKRGGKRVR